MTTETARLQLRFAKRLLEDADLHYRVHRHWDRYAADNLLRAANDVTRARQTLARAERKAS